MSSESESVHGSALDSVTKIVSVYLERSTGLSPEQVVSLVDGIFKVLLRDAAAGVSSATDTTDLDNSVVSTAAAAAAEPPNPAVPVDQSITPDYLVCLEDGSKVKLLKRYLRAKYDLTPREYREKWGLPKDYPMVAPAYSAKRTAIAQASGLGARRPAAVTNPTTTETQLEEAETPVEATETIVEPAPTAPTTAAPKRRQPASKPVPDAVSQASTEIAAPKKKRAARAGSSSAADEKKP